METKNLSFTQTVNSQPAAVYRAFTNANALTQWLCNDARLSVREGGRLYLYWQQGGYYATGEFNTVVENEGLGFSWRGKGEQHSSQVNITLTKLEDGTKVELNHTEVEPAAVDDIQQGWETGLANLKAVLEKGLDKRVYDRPFMGILINGILNEEQLAKQNIAAQGAIDVGGALAGTGAADLGLQAGDIVTKLNEVEIANFAAIGQALNNTSVGQKIAIDYYHDGQKHSDQMELKSRPAPANPGSPAAFAETLQDTYAQLDAELDEIFADVSDEVASTAPAEGEWSAKEVIAHLIVTERSTQMGMGVQLADNALNVFPSNDSAFLQGILSVYPTLEALLAAWKQAEAETVAIVANLPEAYTTRTVDYLALSLSLLQGLPSHTRGHFNQIREVVATAREQLKPVAA